MKDNGTGLLILILLISWWLTSGKKRKKEAHGIENTKARVVAHEKRHARVLRAFGIWCYYRVWKSWDGVWEGVTRIGNTRRWNQLSKEEQAAVYMAGAMGPNGPSGEGCSSDLAEVDARTSRSKARAIASQHLGLF